MGQEHQARLVVPPEESRAETDSVSPAQTFLMFLSHFLSAMTSFISKVYIRLFSKLLRQYNSRYIIIRVHSAFSLVASCVLLKYTRTDDVN